MIFSSEVQGKNEKFGLNEHPMDGKRITARFMLYYVVSLRKVIIVLYLAKNPVWVRLDLKLK